MSEYPAEKTKPGRSLIIFPGALGDLISLIPAIRAIARRQTGIELELMARGELARFAAGRAAIVRGHSIDRREVSQLFAADEAVEARTFFGSFERIDSFFAADDERFRRSLGAVARGELRFYPFRPPGDGHVAECYLRAIGEPAGTPVENGIDVLPEDVAAAARILDRFGMRERNFMLVMPGSGSAKKNWPTANFCELARRLSARIASLFVLGPVEIALEPVLKAQGLPVISGIELGEVAGLARMAKCFVGNDSGVSHLAAAAGAAGFALFGPTDAKRWRPLGRVSVIQHDALADLTVNEVVAAVSAAEFGGVTPQRTV